MRTITSVSLSGGQGKTSLVYFLAKKLAEKYKVLVIDLDPQHNITTFLRLFLEQDDVSVFEFIKGSCDVTDAIYPVEKIENLFIIPADDGLEAANDYLSASGFGVIQLKNRLKSLVDKKINFDYCLIDTPPQKSQLCKTGIGASDYHLISVEPETKGVLSLARTIEAIEEIKASGVVATQMLGLLLFRDRWIGGNRPKESTKAIDEIQNYIDSDLILPPFHYSEIAKRAIATNSTLEMLGKSNLAYPFEILQSKIEALT